MKDEYKELKDLKPLWIEIKKVIFDFWNKL